MSNIQPPRESWEITNLTNSMLSMQMPPVPLLRPGQTVDLLDFVPSNVVSSSPVYRNYVAKKMISTTGFLHAHDDKSDTDHTHDHTHNGLDILTGGEFSNADALHTHDIIPPFEQAEEVDLTEYVRKDGSILQISDVANDGDAINNAVNLAHDEDHSLLNHTDIDIYTVDNLKRLMNGFNVDDLHTHSGLDGVSIHNNLGGLNSGDYKHLTSSEKIDFTTLTDGSNADDLHSHVGVSVEDVIDSIGEISSQPAIEAICDENAPHSNTIRCYLEGNPSNTVDVVCEIVQHIGSNFGYLDECVPRLEMGASLWVVKKEGVYYSVDTFNVSEPCLLVDELCDVDIDTPTDGQVLSYNNLTGNWENTDGNVSAVGGTVYINDIQPTGGGNVGDKVYLSGSNDEILTSCSADDLNIRVYVIAMIGPSNLRPSVTVNGTAVGNWNYDAYESDNRVLFRGYADLSPLVGETVTATHEDGATDSCTVTEDAAPVISSVSFTGTYPGSQIEYKAVDTVGMTVTADIAFDQVEVENSGACDYQLVTGFSSTTHAWTANIADRGDTRVSYPARVRVRKPSGTWSDWVYTNASSSVDHTDEVYLNNLYPSVQTMNQGSIAYPGVQEAIKGTETVSVTCACSDFDTITYSDPTGNELTIPNTSTYQSPKLSVAGRTSGNYNISSSNYRVSCNRTNNDATTTKSLVVYIADVALTVTMSEASRLRTGGNDGTAAQNHTITMTCNQNVLSTTTPTIGAASANGGTWSGSFSGGPSVYTRTLIVDESAGDLPATYTYQGLSVFNLANIETTSYISVPNSQYVIGGFVTRDITLAAFANEATFNAAVSSEYLTKCTLSWPPKALPNKRAFNTTSTPDANSWCFAGNLNEHPTTARILDTGATDASSDDTTITVEETI
jgi:hypothetical protein